ncbi:hypothetical protein FTO68_06275 [Methanocalculus taiwanensis]|uniref:Major tropism determinant N-terminal domain-containing protein n=1 Tax=Methanocalculus taiwanensis TaxID=106207 RepID=A0ABD4TIR5_9EURY|nr:hypothetical protein [Methanocalculus taiwanensis]MCQ1538591.1 hypothetical protein [Methanocalculus taiwanensis]
MSDLLYKIKNRRGLAAEWLLTDPVLSAGEFGIESDSGKIKVGDGSTAWSELPYLTDHDHDEAYAAIGHAHDEAYSAIDHDHDEAYAAIGHAHDGIGDALTIKGVIVDDTDLADGRILVYDESGDGSLKYMDPPEGGGGGGAAPLIYDHRGPGYPAISLPEELSFIGLGWYDAPAVGGLSPLLHAAVLHPNGKAYFFPRYIDPGDPGDPTYPDQDRIRVYDTALEVWSSIQITESALEYFDKLRCACVAADGLIYWWMGDLSDKIIKFDPTTEALTILTVSFTGGQYEPADFYGKVGSLVPLPDGRIVCWLDTSDSDLPIYDPATNTADLISLGSGDYGSCTNGILSSSGLVYAGPGYEDAKLRIFNPADNSLSGVVVSDLGGGGIITEDQYGRIWIIDNAAPIDKKIHIYDPHEWTSTGPGRLYEAAYPVPFWDGAGAGIVPIGWASAHLAKNGRIYCVPAGSDQVMDNAYAYIGSSYWSPILEIDPSTVVLNLSDGTFTYAARVILVERDSQISERSSGGLMLPDGRIWAVPRADKTGFLEIDPGPGGFPVDPLISVYHNKI